MNDILDFFFLLMYNIAQMYMWRILLIIEKFQYYVA